MEVGDCSLWHYLIFCEEFVNNNCNNNIICWVCEEPMSGHPAFKCLECGFVQHKSCTQPPGLTGIEVKHDILSRHHLILRDESKNNDKQEVVCLGCGETTSSPTCRCSIPKCTFHLHTSCHQLSRAIQHITHPEHPLLLTLPRLFAWCGFCGKDREKETTLLYSCRPCDFDLDNKCASFLKITNDDCDQHMFILSRKPIPFKCEACGELTNDVACQCSICGILTHPMCACFPPTIKIRVHHHLFSRTYCLRRVKKMENAICNLCCKKVNTECGAYYCQICDYIVHMKCAKLNQDKSTINSKATEFEDYRRHLVYLIEGLNLEENKTANALSRINHYSHPQHDLILKHDDPGSDKRCKACMQFITFAPFYCCDECNIFLHIRCVELPEIIWRLPFSKLPCTLSSQPPDTDKLFLCGRCLRHRQGFFYDHEDGKGKFRNDVQCFLIPETINHESHEHSLHIPVLADDGVKRICPGCGEEIDGRRWRIICSNCEFWLCFKCATFPLVAKYRYHPHLLKLTYACKDDWEECYCLICEEKRNSERWFYSCADCDFAAHIQCVIGSSLKMGSHQHPIVVVKGVKDFPKCHSCEESIRCHLSLACIQCKFNFHIKCYYS